MRAGGLMQPPPTGEAECTNAGRLARLLRDLGAHRATYIRNDGQQCTLCRTLVRTVHTLSPTVPADAADEGDAADAADELMRRLLLQPKEKMRLQLQVPMHDPSPR